MKRCGRCGEEKDFSEFGKDQREKDGLNRTCKPCVRQRSKASYQRNRDKALAYSKRWSQENKPKRNSYSRAWQSRNRERVLAYKRRYRKENAEAIKAAWKRYYEANRERLLDKNRAWFEQRPEYMELWRTPERNRMYNQRRRARLLDAFVADVIFDEILQRDVGICGICGDAIFDDPELDHIKPLTKQGTHEPGNVQLAHKLCNRKKNNRENFQLAA